MKRLKSFILIFAYAVAVFQFTVPFFSYYSNYTYFSEVACINKHNPELECNGSCQLKKMLKTQHDHNNSAPGEAIQIVKSSSTIFFFETVLKQDNELASSTYVNRGDFIVPSQYITLPTTPPPQIG